MARLAVHRYEGLFLTPHAELIGPAASTESAAQVAASGRDVLK
jgi:hypothetical protein